MTEKFTDAEKHREAMREVGQTPTCLPAPRRERVRWTREKAEWQTAVMQEIADDYAERAKTERLL